MSVKVLKQELECQILPTVGNKLVLLVCLKLGITEKRLKYTVDQLQEIKIVKKKKAEPNTALGLLSFPKSAYWQILQANLDKVLNLGNLTFAVAYVPTVNKDKLYTE